LGASSCRRGCVTAQEDVPLVWAKIGTDLALGALYCQFAVPGVGPTKRGPVLEEQHLATIISKLGLASNRFWDLVVLGDFNLDPTRAADAGYYLRDLLRRWLSFASQHGLQWAPTGPTFRSDGAFGGAHCKSTIDLAFSRCRDAVEAYRTRPRPLG